jgi:hypothetical protein
LRKFWWEIRIISVIIRWWKWGEKRLQHAWHVFSAITYLEMPPPYLNVCIRVSLSFSIHFASKSLIMFCLVHDLIWVIGGFFFLDLLACFFFPFVLLWLGTCVIVFKECGDLALSSAPGSLMISISF